MLVGSPVLYSPKTVTGSYVVCGRSREETDDSMGGLTKRVYKDKGRRVREPDAGRKHLIQNDLVSVRVSVCVYV